MPKLTGGQTVIESLKAQGVDTVFGIISIHNLDLFDSLFGSQDSIQFIGGRLELGCGFMADGYTRATGKPGILFTSTGPGAADSMGAIGEAYFSGSPILEITTNVEQEFLGSGKLATHETKDQLGMFKAVTDWNAMIPEVESIPDNITEAFDRFQTRRPRPIELEIPTNLLATEADVEMLTARQPDIPQGDPNQVEKALQMLLKAKRPAILVGEEVQQLGGTQQIIELAEKLGAAVVTSDGAKGAFPEDHAQSLGQIMGRRIWGENPVQDWLGTCDLVIVLGSILPQRSTSGIGLQLPKEMVHVLLDGEAMARTTPLPCPSSPTPRPWSSSGWAPSATRMFIRATDSRTTSQPSEARFARVWKRAGAMSCGSTRPCARLLPGTPSSLWTRRWPPAGPPAAWRSTNPGPTCIPTVGSDLGSPSRRPSAPKLASRIVRWSA